jgi:hypothetical protein
MYIYGWVLVLPGTFCLTPLASVHLDKGVESISEMDVPTGRILREDDHDKDGQQKEHIILILALNYRQGGMVFFTFPKFYLWQRWRFKFMSRKICTCI